MFSARAFVAQTFLSAVSPTFLSADLTSVSFVVARIEPMQAGKPCDTADRNVCATLEQFQKNCGLLSPALSSTGGEGETTVTAQTRL